MSIFHCCFLTMTIVSLKQLHKNRLTDTELDSTPDIPADDFVFLTHTPRTKDKNGRHKFAKSPGVRSGPIIVKQARDAFQGYPSGRSRFAVPTSTSRGPFSYDTLLSSLTC